MIGDMISKVRIEKGMTKTELARLANINIGHLTHIEKGERNPSHKALKSICNALDIPYQQLMYTYDKKLNEDHELYNFIEHIPYDRILAVDKLDNFIHCPSSMPSASLAIKMPDDSMEPTYKKDDYLFMEFNAVLNDQDVGLFYLDGNLYVRRFFNKNNSFLLKCDNKDFDSVKVSGINDFYIIGKILN